MDRFSVVLTDPDQLVRAGLRRVLAESAYDLVGETRTLEDALVELERSTVDLLLLEINGVEESAAGRLREVRARGTKIVVLTANSSSAALDRAMQWGVDAYLLKEISPDALHRSLQLVMLGQQVFQAL
jgi:two-component system nitrate/nitrite response regulator NarL